MKDRSIRRGLAVVFIAIIAIAFMLLAPGRKKVVHPPNDDPWKLVSYDPDNPVGTYLGNGFISTTIMGDGVGSQNGRPLPCYMAGLYDDEKLVPIPTWSDLRLYDGKTQFVIDKNADYKQTLDMKTGILTTEATWRVNGKTLKGKIEVIVSRAMPNVGLLSAKLRPDFAGHVVLTSEMPSGQLTCSGGDSIDSPRLGAAEVSAFLVEGNRYVGMATTLSSDAKYSPEDVSGGDMAQNLRISVRETHRFSITRYAALVVGEGSLPTQAAATDALNKAASSEAKFLSPHKAAMAKLWARDIIIDGPKKDQQAIHSCMFYLMQSVREGSQWSIPPMGLSNLSFSGHVFWDADTWMFPALILQHPELARSIVDYRYNTLPGAIANAKADGFAGAEYAWESGMTGREDTPEGLPYRYERHINGDVALAQWQYYLATGDLNWLKTRGYPVIKATADYWVTRATPSNGRYEIRQVVPPDENAEKVNNSAYTNAIAKMNLMIASKAAALTGNAPNPKWSAVASKLYIPFDKQHRRFIAFDGYKGWKAKQADTELLAYPLQFEMPGYIMPLVYTNTFNYYAPKVMRYGPAMTSSAHSVIAARLGDRDRGYSEFVKSYKPFLRGPFNYFNEKQSKTWDNMCFLTGAAGPIQAAIWGLAGAHMDYFPQDPSKAALTWNPCLPRKWKSIKITGVQWHGKTFDVTVSKGNKVTLTPR